MFKWVRRIVQKWENNIAVAKARRAEYDALFEVLGYDGDVQSIIWCRDNGFRDQDGVDYELGPDELPPRSKFFMRVVK